jgi:hypothetical protein
VTRACESPRAPGTRVLGSVFFSGSSEPGWAQGERIQSAAYPGGRRFSKLGLLVRGGTGVTLRIREGIRTWITGWTRGRPTQTLTIEPSETERCGNRWKVFFGGFLFVEPRCLMLTVEVGEQSTTVPFGLRRSCRA